VKDAFHVFYASFPLSEGYRLGDFGILDDSVFRRLGNISEFQLGGFGERSDSTATSQLDFTSKSGVSVEFHGKASMAGSVPVKAGLDVSFSTENAVMFNAAGCQASAIDDQVKLATAIMDLFERGQWRKEYVVVTTLVRAKTTTVLVSSSDSAKISLEASTDRIDAIDLGDASLQLAIKSFKDIAVKIVTEGGLTPLLGLSGIHGGFFEDDKFGPASALLKSIAPKTVASHKELRAASLLSFGTIR
jgi:hypothetical protein